LVTNDILRGRFPAVGDQTTAFPAGGPRRRPSRRRADRPWALPGTTGRSAPSFGHQRHLPRPDLCGWWPNDRSSCAWNGAPERLPHSAWGVV